MAGKLIKRTVVHHGESLVFYCSDEELDEFLEPNCLELLWFWKVRETDRNLAPEIKAALEKLQSDGALKDLADRLYPRFRPKEGEELEWKLRTVEYQGETLEFCCADDQLDFFMKKESLDVLWWQHQQKTNPHFSEWMDLFLDCRTEAEIEALRQEMYARWRAGMKRVD